MKPSMLIILFFVLALSGGAGLVYYQYQLPDLEFISSDVNERLLKIDNLNSSISELALRSRVNIDTNYDRLVRSMVSLDSAIKGLETTHFSDPAIQGTLLEKRFIGFKGALENKKDLIENFKSHNSVLRNSEKYAPIVGRELMAIAEGEGLPEVAKFYSEVVLAVMEYAKRGQTTNADSLKILLSKIPETEKLLPSEFLIRIIEFTNHVSTVIEEKLQTDQYLGKALSSTSDSRLEALSKAWVEWLAGFNRDQGHFRIAIMVYILFLLAFSGFIAFKLRDLYVSLDGKVAQRTAEVKKAYEELKQSEMQLMQTEKMASLGQLVAGVAHEINTPLSYISSNIDTLRSNMGELGVILNSASMISEEAAQTSPDKNKLLLFVKRVVVAYRELKKRETISEIDQLLNDSSYGLGEISKLVNSLKDFSRVDSSNTDEADIHNGLEATIKICGDVLGKRKLVKSYAADLPKIQCVPAQLNQVFMNILTNAAQATDGLDGVIAIETRKADYGLEIVFKDNGVGMDEATRNRMFDPYFTTKDVNEGMGLGMSIAYKIIHNHGGEISVESEPGQGTQITLRLPTTK